MKRISEFICLANEINLIIKIKIKIKMWIYQDGIVLIINRINKIRLTIMTEDFKIIKLVM